MAIKISMEQQILPKNLPFFGLSTSQFIFNLFEEGFHWMLVLYLDWQELEYYLDKFILIITAFLATASNLEKNNNGYQLLTDCLGIPYQDTKNCISTIVFVFDIGIDANLFVAQIPTDELRRARNATREAFFK